jgi:hypothetical protein
MSGDSPEQRDEKLTLRPPAAGTPLGADPASANPETLTPQGDPAFLHLLRRALPPKQEPPAAADSEAPTAPPQSGPAGAEQLGPPEVPGYQILGELGRGGMGVVYKARHVQLGRIVALKMILAGGHAGAQARARFRTEAEAVARLQHPHVVQIYDVGEHQGLPYLALEFCPSGSLAARLDGTPLPPQPAAALAETLARAVHAAHQAGIIHRDLKPANVLLAADGTPKITDFGLAKRLDEAGGPTPSGAVLGTPSYMAPEQAGTTEASEQAVAVSREVGPAADVYALGAILYELLTGRPPFKGSSPMNTVLQLLTCEPVPPRLLVPKVPRDLETVCLKCLQKDARKRYASAADLAADLGRWLRGEAVLAQPPSLGYLLGIWVRHDFRAPGWMVALGLWCGMWLGVVTWAIVLQGYVGWMAMKANVYSPSRDQPWMLSYCPWPTMSLPAWLTVPPVVLCYAAVAALGPFIVLFVRPRNRAAELIAGTATGMIAAITYYGVSLGWLTVMAAAVPSLEADLGLVREAARAEDGPGVNTLCSKTVYDACAAIPVGIWLGLLFAFAVCGISGVGGTLVAGGLLRRDGSIRSMALRYVEVTLPWLLLLMGGLLLLYNPRPPAVSMLLGADDVYVLEILVYSLMWALAGLAVAGVFRAWHWLIRVLLHAAWIVGFVLIASYLRGG